jgi:hypothetical protein
MVVPNADVIVRPAEETEPELAPSRFAQRLRAASSEETEAAYVAARDAWTAAMRAANSGRAADLASLAITQEAYEAAVAERARWLPTTPTVRTAISVEGSGGNRELDMVVAQELDWRHVNDPKPQRGFKGLVKKILGE